MDNKDKKESKELIDINSDETNDSVIKNKKIESRANYAGNQEVIDEEVD